MKTDKQERYERIREGTFKTCVNGCDKPIQPPSLVICRDCMDRITANLEEIGRRFEARAEAEKAEKEARKSDRDSSSAQLTLWK